MSAKAKDPNEPRPFAIPLGATICFITTVGGMAYDVGPIKAAYITAHDPSDALRVALTIGNGIGILLVVTGIVLRAAGAIRKA